MQSCLSKCWIYLLLLSSMITLYTIHIMYHSPFPKRSFEPLFAIDSSEVVLHVKVNSSLISSWSTEEFKEKQNRTKNAIRLFYNEKNVTENCPVTPPGLVGKISLMKTITPTFHDLLNQFNNSSLQADGRYQPPACIPRFLLAIIVPYRNRFQHLNVFLRNIHPFVQKHQVDYTIFVVEQAGNDQFNRGMLMNIGFVEAMKIRPFDCFIFHDVDLLPENDKNIYTCSEEPRHMSAAVDIFRYKLPYRDIFGGISTMKMQHFLLVNGYSNAFWGWGGEDDDMSMRIRMNGLHLMRYPPSIARYTMLSHDKQKINPKRYEKLYFGSKRYKTEGLNSLEYYRITIRPCKLFTWILVELKPPQRDNMFLRIIKRFYFPELLQKLSI